MIRVERGRPPSFVAEADFQAAQGGYERYRSEGGSRGKQTTLEFDLAIGPYLNQAAGYAHELFLHKCAYTEVPVRAQLHLHRPEIDAYDERLPSSPQHYWWTAFWYRNWYASSYEVKGLKRNIFPVLGERAPEPRLDQLEDGEVPPQFLDRGVLLDPCEDYPQLHLRFDAEGGVRAWAEESTPWLDEDARRRGPETIALLDLNSQPLREARRAACSGVLGGLQERTLPSFGPDPTLPHLGAIRQVLARHLVDTGRLTAARTVLAPELVPILLSEPGRFDGDVIEAVRAALQESHPALAELLTAPPVEVSTTVPEDAPRTPPEEETPAKAIPAIAAIKRVLIENFQAVEHCELVIPAASATEAEPDPVLPTTQATTASLVTGLREGHGASPAGRPWRVLLGENGSGKSSVLRAIALALATGQVEDLVERCDLQWGDLLRRGSTSGRVLVEFSGTDSSIELRFTEAGAEPPETPLSVQCFVRGFGATRLKSETLAGDAPTVRLGNLFDPMEPVVDPQEWLVGLAERDDQGDFNVAAVTIARLLGRSELVAETEDTTGPPYIRNVDGEIRVGGEPLRTLSDGYKAIITLACELMAGAGGGLSDMRNATGIVLVDELGSYLHPRWKVQITRTLRDVFPSMQFLITTHEPLCLRGLVEHEVVRVTPSEPDKDGRWHAEFETIEGSPSRFRVDQLLTSAYFGLDSTIDPDIEQQFLKYYRLLREPTSANEEDRQRMRASLSKHGVLGYTARDQLIYDAIDQFLAKSPQMKPEERRFQRQKTLDLVVDIWRNVSVQREAEPRP